jgi:hypothetical protein
MESFTCVGHPKHYSTAFATTMFLLERSELNKHADGVDTWQTRQPILIIYPNVG